jgi:hypothetical protein
MKDVLRDPKLNADTWNHQVAVGALVTYRKDDGKLLTTRTRSEASVLGGHTAVVWIEGKAGCVALDRVTPIVDGDEP